MTSPMPRAGDVTECPLCGRVAVHARILALCDGCGRRVHVWQRAGRPFDLASLLLGRAPRVPGA